MRLETKQDFRDWMFSVLNPSETTIQRGRRQVCIWGDSGVTYPEVSIEMEAFSRPLWALVPFWKGGGVNGSFEELLSEGA